MTEQSKAKPELTEIDDAPAPTLPEALRMFDFVNARVIDLTQRLISANNEADALQLQLDSLRVTHANFSHLHRDLTSSNSYRAADRIMQLRGLVRRP